MATDLTWLGDSAFRLDSPGGKRIYVHPFLTGPPEALRELVSEGIEIVSLEHGETLNF